jgi:hypothetical protein
MPDTSQRGAESTDRSDIEAALARAAGALTMSLAVGAECDTVLNDAVNRTQQTPGTERRDARVRPTAQGHELSNLRR